jgi:hypothetical protein
LAGFDDGITTAAIKGATLLAHEKAFCTLFDRLTEHLPSLLYFAVSKFNFSLFPKKNRGMTSLNGDPGVKPYFYIKTSILFQHLK